MVFFLFALLLNTTSAQEFHLSSQQFKTRTLDEISIEGNHYHADFLKTRIKNVALKAGLDSSEFYAEYIELMLDHLRFKDDTSAIDADDWQITYPENYLFADINDDKHEDLIFQSNGPFMFDSPAFLIFLSKDKGENYSMYYKDGKIVDIEKSKIINQYDREVNGLKITYVSYGCCELSNWDYINCNFYFLDDRDHWKEDIKLWSVNTNNMSSFWKKK